MSMRKRLEQVVIKHLRGEVLDFFSYKLNLESDVHKDNVDKLFRNLDGQAGNNLKAILDHFIKVADPTINTYTDLFTSEELAQYERVKQFGKEIAQVGDYYQYKHYKLPIARFGNETFLYRQGLDALKTTANIGGKAIFDVGAFVGDSALIFAENFPESDIYCFEPNAANYAHAQTTLLLNNLNCSRVKFYNVALGSRIGHGVMQESSAASYLAIPDALCDQQVEVNTLDNFVGKNAVDIGLIKIDVEGHEQQVLEGALNTIKAHKPILIVSIYHNYEQFFGIKPFLESLDLGYSFDFFWGISGQVNEEIMLLCEVR